jgi:hypothetical protein
MTIILEPDPDRPGWWMATIGEFPAIHAYAETRALCLDRLDRILAAVGPITGSVDPAALHRFLWSEYTRSAA